MSDFRAPRWSDAQVALIDQLAAAIDDPGRQHELREIWATIAADDELRAVIRDEIDVIEAERRGL